MIDQHDGATTSRETTRCRGGSCGQSIESVAIRFVIALFFLINLAGCAALARHESATRAPKDAATPWNPPAKLRKQPERKLGLQSIPGDLLTRNWTLEDILDFALRNNPATRASWETARAAAAKVGSERGAYLPQIDASASYTNTKNSYSLQTTVAQKTYQPSLALQFILFDFGKRGADVQEARQNSYAANWTHNATIQSVILEVETAYYQYLSAKAIRTADSAAVDEAGVNLDAAQERQKAGLATTADVLQAKSNLAQKKLALQAVEGQIQTIRGALATAMGLSPTIDYDIGFLPNDIPVADVSQTVNDLLDEAQASRPDLAAARATALAAKAHAKSVKRDGFPVVSLQGTISRRFYDNPDIYTDNYTKGIYVTLPLFTGFSHSYDVVEAQEQAAAAASRYELLQSSVDLEVWSRYFDLTTAAQQLTTAKEFLESATESHTVALERYKVGVGSILELLAAQSTLEDARTQNVQARTNWFLALAGLAHATGRLELSQASPTQPSPAEQGEER